MRRIIATGALLLASLIPTVCWQKFYAKFTGLTGCASDTARCKFGTLLLCPSQPFGLSDSSLGFF